ncbi:FG-GAP repeat domain-containing protein [Actinoplanes sp. NPDC020271]|uniref:FG-GAP repeat domain-containing protein n=1 Tax=Actinoplanes sp. NPDC020271 TaxID=3363896 RepID=UPI0037B44398
MNQSKRGLPRFTGVLSGSVALTFAAGTVLMPSPAQAQPDATATVAPVNCRPGDVISADRVIADQIRPLMSGRRLGSAINGDRVACARIIVRTVQKRGLGQRAAVIAVATAIAESTLTNHTVATDHDSLGLFQQRPSQGWGNPGQLVDPTYATNAFLDAMVRKYPKNAWMAGDIGAISQRVQTSATPGAYAPEVPDAALIVGALWARVAAPQPGTSTAAPAAVPTGPFQRALVTTGAELGPLDGAHSLTLADWNADGKPDLVVVKASGTVTGKTELRIMDGSRGFSSLLLNTATALGPSDGTQTYTVTDWNADGKPDLVVVQRSGTAGGHVEVRVVDGASYFQKLLVETSTALAPADDSSQFAVADWNADGKPDLVATQTAGTASKKVEVQVLDGATDFQQPLGPAKITTAEPAADGLQATVTDWNADKHPDLVTIRKSAKSDVHVLDGASSLNRYLSQTSTGQAADDQQELLVSDFNGDKRPDLVVVRKSGTATGRAEVTVLGG